MLTKWIHIDDRDPRFNVTFINELLDKKLIIYATKRSFGSDRVLAAINVDKIDWVAVTKNGKMSLEWYDYISYRDWIWK